MSFRLFPKAPKFMDFFRKQNRIIVEAATGLHSLVTEFTECDLRCQRINRLESEGDSINRTITKLLSTTFITPIDREDIHEINMGAETILNHIQAVSNRIGVYEFKEMRFPARRMVANLKVMVMEIGVLIDSLGGKDDVSGIMRHIRDLKGECEMLHLTGLGELYDKEPSQPGEILDIMKWTQVYDRIDKAVTRTWYLAKAMEGIILKNA
jgi:uncharacterized protein